MLEAAFYLAVKSIVSDIDSSLGVDCVKHGCFSPNGTRTTHFALLLTIFFIVLAMLKGRKHININVAN